MIPLFDANAGFGGSAPQQRRAVSRDDLTAEMARLAIGRALVRVAPEELDSDCVGSNESLLSACADSPGLLPCPVVMPDAAGGDAEQVAALLARGAAAVCIRPKADYWLLAEWASGPLLEALHQRRVPVLCRMPEVPLEDVAALAGRLPQLPLILADTGYRWQRVLLPLLGSFPNVHLATGGGFSVHAGLEQVVAAVGSERLLFGTGFPSAEPTAAVTQLTYAGLSDDDKALIGSGNLDRLVGGIAR